MAWFVVTTTVQENARTWQVVVTPDGSEESARQAAREMEGLVGVDVQSIAVIEASDAAEAARLAGMEMPPPPLPRW